MGITPAAAGPTLKRLETEKVTQRLARMRK
jgi:hypothetical protein